VFTARYALSPYIKQIRFVFKGLSTAPWRSLKECRKNDMDYSRQYQKEKVNITRRPLYSSVRNCATQQPTTHCTYNVALFAFTQPLWPWKGSITYSGCVFVILLIQHAKRMSRIILSSVTCLALPYSLHIIS
jgi:hypothetical protein